LTIKEIGAIDCRKSQYYCERPGSISIVIPTAQTYMHSGGTDVIWGLSLQHHTPPVHWAQCTQPCEKNVDKRPLRYLVGTSLSGSDNDAISM